MRLKIESSTTGKNFHKLAFMQYNKTTHNFYYIQLITHSLDFKIKLKYEDSLFFEI